MSVFFFFYNFTLSNRKNILFLIYDILANITPQHTNTACQPSMPESVIHEDLVPEEECKVAFPIMSTSA